MRIEQYDFPQCLSISVFPVSLPVNFRGNFSFYHLLFSCKFSYGFFTQKVKLNKNTESEVNPDTPIKIQIFIGV